jgi:hypothetical protein
MQIRKTKGLGILSSHPRRGKEMKEVAKWPSCGIAEHAKSVPIFTESPIGGRLFYF